MPRTLLVDDDAFIRQMLKDILAETDFEVVGEAVDGSEAFAKYQELKPDLVLMDIIMPDVSGLDAVRNIIAVDPSARIVMCSALGQQAMVREALRAGARDFVIKPFKPRKVVETLQNVWGQ